MPNIESISTQGPTQSATKAKAELRRVAGEIVGQVFYGTLLRQMRSASLKGEYGHGGRGEEIFQSQLDMVFAKEAGTGGNTKLTDALVERFERRAIGAETNKQQRRQKLENLQREINTQQSETVEANRW